MSGKSRLTSKPVIPAPVRFDGERGTFELRPGMAVAYAAAEVGPIVERFCAEVRRRTGVRLDPVAGDPRPEERSVGIELDGGDELGRLPSPAGVSPFGDAPPDERHSLSIDAERVVLRAAEPAGVARALATLTQLLASSSTKQRRIVVPGGRILDAPRYAWRGLSLDLARTFLTLDEVRRVIDLLALYKLNSLHLHLTDDQSWRLPVGRTEGRLADAAFYAADELRALVRYGAERFVAVVPEVDTPGHTSALMRMHPKLDTGRNNVEIDFAPGHRLRVAWLDPDLPATFELIEEVLGGVSEIFSSPYIHIGGDEPFGMPHDLYASYVPRVRDFVRSLGRRPLAWQESARAELGPGDIIQYWFSDLTLPASVPPAIRMRMDDDLVMSHRDLETATALRVPVIVSPLSHCYLDVPYAEPSADPSQAEQQSRLGLRFYAPKTVADSFDWEPADALGAGRAGQVAGIEAAIWAETISGFDDLTFLLLPRLPGVAQRAWSEPRTATWSAHRGRLARHGQLWSQDGLTFFRSSSVNWPDTSRPNPPPSTGQTRSSRAMPSGQ